MSKEEILNILNVLTEADKTQEEINNTPTAAAEVVSDDTKTGIVGKEDPKQADRPQKASGTTDDVMKYVNWIEEITSYNSADAQKQFSNIGKSVAKELRVKANKQGPNTFNLNAPENMDDGTFYEVMRWEVKDDIKYRMYNVNKMKDDDLNGQATDKVLGSVLGGVKLPTVGFAAEIKYNPEYLRNYSTLLSALTKVVVGNNKAIAQENKERDTQEKEAKQTVNNIVKNPSGGGEVKPDNNINIQTIYVDNNEVDLAKLDNKTKGILANAIANKEIAYDDKNQEVKVKKEDLAPLALTWDMKTNKIVSDETADVKPGVETSATGTLTASFIDTLNDVLSEAPIGQTIARAGQAAVRLGRNIAQPAVTAARNAATTLTAIKAGSYIKPGIYDLIGYDFGYTGRTRNTSPKFFPSKKIRSVVDVMNFIENSHIYEDKSGKVKDAMAKGSDTHQFKPTKMVAFRLKNSPDLKDEPIEPEGDKPILKQLPDGTIVIAAWGRIIMASEINEAKPGEKVTPKDLVLTKKDRAEWYILIPKTGPKVNEANIDKIQKELSTEVPNASAEAKPGQKAIGNSQPKPAIGHNQNGAIQKVGQ